MSSSTIEINGRQIGAGLPTYIVAEMSANHVQDFAQAAKIVRAAKFAGADAVKLQTYTPDTLTIDCDSPHFRIGMDTPWEGKTLYELYSKAYMPWDWQPRLKALANDLGLDLFSSPFDSSAVDFLEEMQVPAYKVASFEIVDLPLLLRVARTGRPVILSTGMSTLDEIAEAIATVRVGGGEHLALLKCTSAYPAPLEHMNLRTIPHLMETFGVVAGISDHTLGHNVPVAAVALGASIVEKHLTLSRDVAGPDSAFSMEPAEFKAMVDAIRTVEAAVGQIHYGLSDSERSSLAFRRSLFVVRDIVSGEVFTPANVRSIRPGHGMHTRDLPLVLGRRATRDINRGTPLDWDLVAGDAE